MIEIYVGIDPGKGGAVAFIIGKDVEIHNTPTLKQNGKTTYDIPAMTALLKKYTGHHIYVAIEKQWGRPGQSAQATSSICEGYGIWEGIVGALDMPCYLITPQAWKKNLLRELPKGKNASVVKAKELYPKADLKRTPRCKIEDHNRGDALLIAEHLRRTI